MDRPTVNIRLDDTRIPPPGDGGNNKEWLWAKNPQEFYTLVVMNLGRIEYMTLDHDL